MTQQKLLIKALIDAIERKDKNAINKKLAELKQSNVDINTIDDSRFTLIQYAVQSGDVEIVTLLIQQGADVNMLMYDRNMKPPSLLHLAVAEGHNRVLRLLLKQGVNPNYKDLQGRTPLHAAIDKQDLAAIFLLLAYGADPWIKQGINSKGDDAFEIAQTQIDDAQREAKKIADLTEKPVQAKTSRLRRAFYAFCILISLLSVLTIGAGLIVFYTHLAAPYMILCAAGGLSLLSVAALLAISSAFKSNPKEKLPKRYRQVLGMLKNHQAKNRISKAYYASCFVIALGSMVLLGAGIAMYFNAIAISLPFIPFIAAGSSGVLIAAILTISFACYKRWSDNHEAEELITQAEQDQASSKTSSKPADKHSEEKKEPAEATWTTGSSYKPEMANINASNVHKHRILTESEPALSTLTPDKRAEDEELYYTLPQGIFVKLPTESLIRRADNPSLLSSFNLGPEESDEDTEPLGAPDEPVINKDPSTLSTDARYKQSPVVNNNPPLSCCTLS